MLHVLSTHIQRRLAQSNETKFNLLCSAHHRTKKQQRRWISSQRQQRRGCCLLLQPTPFSFIIGFIVMLFFFPWMILYQWRPVMMVEEVAYHRQSKIDHMLSPTKKKDLKDLVSILSAIRPTTADSTLLPRTASPSFYRWGYDDSSMNNTNTRSSGISFESLEHYIQHLTSPVGHSDYGWSYGPVVAYLDANATLLWDMTIYARRTGNVRERLSIIIPFWQDTLRQYRKYIVEATPASSTYSSRPAWPHLTRALSLKGGGMLPIVFDVMDYTGCQYQNYNYTRRRRRRRDGSLGPSSTTQEEDEMITSSVPMFTLSYSPTCQYAFPIPSYTTVSLARQYPNAKDWDQIFRQRDLQYPWHTKLRKAVWRGAPNGMAKWKRSILDIPRVYLNFLAQNHTDIMDVAVPCYERCRQQRPLQPWIILGNYTPMEDFQNYRAVLDLDGNSWSERFPRLLCQNSVVIKLDPEQIDYFWPTLQAGVHYVAANNLSHLVSVVGYVVADEHQEEMQKIVAQAREWCRQRMVRGHRRDNVFIAVQ